MSGSGVCRSGDFLRTISDAKDDMQLFWEAFPAEGGEARTTYMFCYCDTDRKRPSLEVTTPSPSYTPYTHMLPTEV